MLFGWLDFLVDFTVNNAGRTATVDNDSTRVFVVLDVSMMENRRVKGISTVLRSQFDFILRRFNELAVKELKVDELIIMPGSTYAFNQWI